VSEAEPIAIDRAELVHQAERRKAERSGKPSAAERGGGVGGSHPLSPTKRQKKVNHGIDRNSNVWWF